MSTKRQRRVKRPALPAPTEAQLDEAMLCFERSKTRHQLLKVHERLFLVKVLPEVLIEDGAATADRYRMLEFTTEPDARRWRERAIIRETITAGMRAKP